MRQLKIQKSITNRSSEALDKYLVEIGRAPLISVDEEIELAQKIRKGGPEGERAKDKLVTANLRFVVSVAKQYQHQGLTLTDLIDEGNIGLIKAAQKFDETRGFKFISYAVWWVRQAILKALAEQSRPVRLPLNRSNELIQIVRAKNDLIHNKGISDPSVDEIASASGLDVTLVKNLLEVTRDMISFDSPIKGDEEGDSSYFDFVEDKAQSPEEDVVNHMMEKDVRGLLSVLGEKERDIIEKRYGFNGNEPMSLKAIGDEYNLTKERIRQIEKAALQKLRNNGESVGLEYYSAAI